ncbi:hypothetical protein JHK86_043476 [Glycine max]|nr:hypothetical protein JHK86_043476 [Glycine max]
MKGVVLHLVLVCTFMGDVDATRRGHVIRGNILENLMHHAGNKFCADCGTTEPRWVRKYEMQQFIGYDDGLSCPIVPSQGRSISLALAQSSTSYYNSFMDNKPSEKHQSKHRIGNTFRNSWGRKDSEHKSAKKSTSLAGMVEFVGLIKVNVVKGTHLAIRDVMTSDPYVILSLGHQSVKTRVIKSNLNPVWNESLMLSIPENIPPLKVLVYDKDTFSTDDFMGEAEIDIQPL